MSKKLFRHPNNKGIFEVTNSNTYNLYLRAGFIEVEDICNSYLSEFTKVEEIKTEVKTKKLPKKVTKKTKSK